MDEEKCDVINLHTGECFINKLKNEVTSDEIHDLVYEIHNRPEDFDEGDIDERIHQYEFYELKEIPLDTMNLNEWFVDNYLVEKISKQIQQHQYKYPPIIYDIKNHSIIDGIHRANALKRLGKDKILGYVGLE